MATLEIKYFPDGLLRQLEARARLENRSVDQEVVHLLERALAKPEPASILELRGLGKEVWKNIDSSAYIGRERESWD